MSVQVNGSYLVLSKAAVSRLKEHSSPQIYTMTMV